MNWIDVKDELPEPDDKPVLAVCDGRVIIALYGYVDDADDFVWMQVYGGLDGDPYFDDHYDVTKWMPIPTP